MKDLLIKQRANGLMDIEIGEHDLLSTDGMETAVAVLLFTDARAAESEVRDAAKRRGWVGNILSDTDLGSKLWLTDQVRNTPEVQNKIKWWVLDALRPLQTSGLVSDVVVTVATKDARGIRLTIELAVKDDQKKKYQYWLSTDLRNLTEGDYGN